MQIEPFRWSPSGTYIAHLWKAATQQHHRELLPALRRLIPRDAVIFDVGAHAGQFAKLFASLAPDGRVWSFEPGSYARSILRVALWLNRVRNVSVVPMGLGETQGVASLSLPVKRPGSYGFGLAHLGAAEARWSRVAVEPIALTTLDGFAAAQGIDRLDFIKADVEGWEGAMLRGGIETLWRLKPRLLLELDTGHLARAGDTLGGTFELLAKLGYRPYSLDPSGGLVPVADPEEGDILWLPQGDPLA
ncbi:MAG TPA: FkbM family methyltransferase [Aliidongia sp.]|nr:FkbM family methyltransferase [Aliidongia sp.]